MDQFERFLEYQKELVEAQLKIIKKYQLSISSQKRTSKLDLVAQILHDAGCPLHVSEIIRIAAQKYHAEMDRDSIVSALLKKIQANQRFSKTAPNTFSLRKDESHDS